MTSPAFQPSHSAKVAVYDANNTFVTLLPVWKTLSCQDAFNDVGQFSLVLPRSAPNLDAVLAMDVGTIGIEIDGVERQRFLLEDDSDDSAVEEGVDREVTIEGRGALAMLEWAILINPDPSVEARPFTAQTIGRIFGTLLNEAKTRGCFPGLTWNFTDLTDSSGANWANNVTVALENGGDLLKCLQSLIEQGWVDARMNGLVLELYNPDSATGLARDMPGVIVRPMREGTAAARKKTRRGVATDILLVGDQYVQVTRSDVTARNHLTRRESYVAAGGYSDTGQLSLIGDKTLARLSSPQEGIELDYDLTNGLAPWPWQDFRCGDWIKRDDEVVDINGQKGRQVSTASFRVRGITVAWDNDLNRVVTLELNTLFLENDIKVARALDTLTNGSSFVSTPNPEPGVDNTVPANVGSIGLTASAYMTNDGRTYAGYTATWQAVITNSDGSPIYDFNHYGISWQVGSDPWGAEQTITQGTTAFLGGILPGLTVQARIRAYDNNGHSSPGYTFSNALTAPGDAAAPGVPSTPFVDPMIGGLRVTWDGLDNAGNPMPQDFYKLEVHASTSTNFTPQAATLIDTLYTAGTSPLVDLAYGSTWYVRFVSVDLTGNRSNPSAQGSGLAGFVGNVDLSSGAVDDSKISTVSATKIVAGLLQADMTLTGRIKSATTGQRFEIDPTGFKLFDASNATVAQMTTTGISVNGAIMAGGRVEGSQFLTAKLADLQAVNYDADYASLDSAGGLQVFRESVTNLCVNPCGDPGNDISNLTWQLANQLLPDYWNIAVGSGSSALSTKPGFDRVFAQTGYDLPWQVSVTRAVNTTNEVASYMAPVTPGTLYTISCWFYLSAIAATPYVRIAWYVAQSDPVSSPVSVTDLGNASTVQNNYNRYVKQVTVPSNAHYARVCFRDHSTDPAGRWHFTGVQFEIGDHATNFADALSQPNCHPADGSANYIFCYSRRDAGAIARVGGRGAVDRFAGAAVATSFRTAETGRRLVIETTRGQTSAIGRLQWYDEGQSTPTVLGVDRSGNDYPFDGAATVTHLYALTPAENSGGRYGRMLLGSHEAGFGMVKQSGSWVLPYMSMDPGASGGTGGNTGFSGNGGVSAVSFGSTSSREIKSDIRYLKKDHGYLSRTRQLRPARYKLKEDPEGPVRLGIVAEEASEVAPEVVGHHHTTGAPQTIDLYAYSTAILLGLQELADKVDALEERIA